MSDSFHSFFAVAKHTEIRYYPYHSLMLNIPLAIYILLCCCPGGNKMYQITMGVEQYHNRTTIYPTSQLFATASHNSILHFLTPCSISLQHLLAAFIGAKCIFVSGDLLHLLYCCLFKGQAPQHMSVIVSIMSSFVIHFLLVINLFFLLVLLFFSYSSCFHSIVLHLLYSFYSILHCSSLSLG